MNGKKISPNRQKKEKIVAELSEKVNRSRGLVFTNYQGLTHKQIEDLKKKLRLANADIMVTKNTLLKLSLLNSQFSNLNSQLSDPTATLIVYGDPIEPLKQLAQSIKQFNLPIIKFGILDGKTLTSQELLRISTLPSRDVLLMQLLGQMQAPIYGLHRALSWNVQKLVMTLKAIETKKT